MAEKSNELTRVSDDGESPDVPATAVGATDTYQTATLGEYPNTDDERREIDVNTASEETPDDTEQIRAQIETTRSQMGETIDAIQEKLSISNIKDQVSEQITSAVESARDAVYDATVGKAGEFMQNVGRSIGDVTGNVGDALSDTGTSVYRSARRNPLPFALLAIGIGSLILIARSRNSKKATYARSYRYDYDAGNYIDEGNEYYARSGERGRRRDQRSTLNVAGEKVSNAASSAYSGVSGAASSAYQGVSGAASSAYQGVGSLAGSAYEQAGNVGTQARRLAEQAQDQYEYHLEENPLAVGAVALAVGAAVGFMVPSTRYEGELMGEYRDNLVQKASDAARDAYGKVQQVATEVGGKVQEVAGEAIRTAREEAKNQDLIQ